MIRITPDGTAGEALPPLAYITHRSPLSRPVLALTRALRAAAALRYVPAADRHLDIGCGDGYLLQRSPCRERIGIDRAMGEDAADLRFPADHFDVVTMLAVIEHVGEPGRVMAEVARVLRQGGLFVLTTPARAAERFIRLYVRDIDDEHETYHDLASIRALAGSAFAVTAHHTFIFGLNQAFCLEKN
jgi:SAM-dependent methyltransferase